MTRTSGPSTKRLRNWKSYSRFTQGSAGFGPEKSKYALPILLDDVARNFPDLTINAFHMGYPYCDDLNMIAMGHPKVYVCLSVLVPWAVSAPHKFAKSIGEALRWVGPDKIIWGTDDGGFAAQAGAAVKGMREFQISEDMQEQ